MKFQMEERIFVAVHAGGLAYTDRQREVGGDYARLAFLPYHSLELQVDRGCPLHLERQIRRAAAEIQAKRGQEFQTSTCGQTVRLGGAK